MRSIREIIFFSQPPHTGLIKASSTLIERHERARMLIFCDCLNQGKAIWPIWLIILFENTLNKHSLTVKGLADSLSSLPATTFPFCLVSLSFSMEGGFTNTMKGLNSAVRRCFIIWEGERGKWGEEDTGKLWRSIDGGTWKIKSWLKSFYWQTDMQHKVKKFRDSCSEDKTVSSERHS